jgi:SNF2 family DNA or RNA helicase
MEMNASEKSLTGTVRMLSSGLQTSEWEVEDEQGTYSVNLGAADECTCRQNMPCVHILACRTQLIGLAQPTVAPKEGKAYTRAGMIKRVLSEREKRAFTERFTLIPSENWHGEHALMTADNVSYKITLRNDGTGYCSCSDFSTNKLGTCKHLMYVKAQVSPKKDAFPFLEIYLDPLKNYRITWHGPTTKKQAELLRLYFGNQSHILENRVMMFFGFVKEARKFPNIKIRPEVLDKIEREFEKNLLEQKAQDEKFDFSILKTELYPYQKEGIRFATFRKGAIIADEMGLGKTVQAIGTALFKKKFLGFTRCLVVCPASLKQQWMNEIHKFCDEKAVVVPGNDYWHYQEYFHIVSYETVVRDLELINRVGYDFVILDEAQRIRNFETLTSNAIKAIKKSHGLVITGTPIENKLVDIYSITAFIDPHLLTPLWEFSYQHCYFDLQNENKISGYYNLQNLKEKLAPVLLRREKTEVLSQRSKLTNIDIPVEMHPVQRDLHTQFARSISILIHKKLKTAYDWQALVLTLQKMRMVCDATFLVDEEHDFSPKMDVLEEILLEKVDLNTRKVIIFSEWTAMLDRISVFLSRNGIGFAKLTGNVPVKSRQKRVDEFNNEENCRVFLATEAGGAGLNLQAADTVINFELPWNPAKKKQRIGRMDRLGQINPQLTVINLFMKDSIETRLMTTLDLKQDLFDSLLLTDNQTDEVDFSGRSQLLKLLEDVVEEVPEEDDIQKILQSGIDFLSGIYRKSTGKDLLPSGTKLQKDQATGEWVLRFKID